MYRWMTAITLAAGVTAVLPPAAAAQASVELRIYWERGDDGWHPRRGTYRDGYLGAPLRREIVHRRHLREIRVPPGHLPPPGLCRLWYPGRPPGHQPPPERCHHLLRHPHPGAVILGAPDHPRLRGGPPHGLRRGPPHRKGRGNRGKKWRKGRGHG